MADKDTVTKDYMQDSEHFADAFNFLLYGGRQVIKPEQLKPLDTTSIVLPYGEEGKPVPIQKYRDVLKMVTAGDGISIGRPLIVSRDTSSCEYIVFKLASAVLPFFEYCPRLLIRPSNSSTAQKIAPPLSQHFIKNFSSVMPSATSDFNLGSSPRSFFGMLAHCSKSAQ